MRYWDTSAIVPLLVQEATSDSRRKLLEEDPFIVTWWGTRIECASAVGRRHREAALDDATLRQTLQALDAAADSWAEVEPSQVLRRTALRLLRTHPLRPADALQLAAAVTACRGDPSSLPLVTADQRLAAAAEKEGFPLVAAGAVRRHIEPRPEA